MQETIDRLHESRLAEIYRAFSVLKCGDCNNPMDWWYRGWHDEAEKREELRTYLGSIDDADAVEEDEWYFVQSNVAKWF